MKMYEVGGCVRDEILGVPSKDIDFAVVLDETDYVEGSLWVPPFVMMVTNLKQMGFKIFLETPEYFTVRAQFPRELTEASYSVPASVFEMRNGLTADFVLARKERGYADGRRPDSVEVGTLEDDLARRDFTMNAIAKDTDGTLIDPFGGVADIEKRVIRAVGDPLERLAEDALRAVRAIRFAVTKGFSIDPELEAALDNREICEKIKHKISDERIQVELSKMFRYDTISSLYELSKRNRLTTAMFSGSVSLDATMKTRGRGEPPRRQKQKPNLPEARNGCGCSCHSSPHVMHMAACC